MFSPLISMGDHVQFNSSVVRGAPVDILNLDTCYSQCRPRRRIRNNTSPASCDSLHPFVISPLALSVISALNSHCSVNIITFISSN
jgi:hypothetical protein